MIAQPNTDHQLKLDVARELWGTYHRTFLVRMDLIERIAAIGAAADNWYQGATPHTASPDVVAGTVGSRLAFQLGLPSVAALEARFLSLQKRQLPQNRDLAKWRLTAPTPGTQPTQGEIDHTALVTHAGHWRGVPDDWRCPGCWRAKIEIIRPSKKAPWAFEVWESRVFDISTGSPQPIWLCGDCKNARVSLAKEAGVASEFVSLADLHAIVRAKPHQRHAFDNDAITDVIEYLQWRESECIWD